MLFVSLVDVGGGAGVVMSLLLLDLLDWLLLVSVAVVICVCC